MLARVAARPLLQATKVNRQSLVRSLHVDNKVYNAAGFDTTAMSSSLRAQRQDYRNGTALAIKMIAFCGLGFSIPFVASAYQISKAAQS
ncbi:hypothetical protein ACM66B_004234 [Microbotryomycetes sp. NB124-2]